jgi:hypothetical protein
LGQQLERRLGQQLLQEHLLPEQEWWQGHRQITALQPQPESGSKLSTSSLAFLSLYELILLLITGRWINLKSVPFIISYATS